MEHSDDYKQLIDVIKLVVIEQSAERVIGITNPSNLFRLAKKHEIAHLVGYAMKRGLVSLPDDNLQMKLLEQHYQALKRVMILEHEISSIRRSFEEEKIDFIFLKGAVLRKYYPEEFMRISGDMDVLVRSDDLELAERVLTEKLGYQVKEKGVHHNHVLSPSGINLDLHFTLTERINKAKSYLDEVWSRSRLADGHKHEYVMNDDMFYLFHMYHASVHFQLGGCGIRAVLDTWILNHRIQFNSEARKNLLEKSNLLKFSNALEQIAEEWFSKNDLKLSTDIEEYILSGGLYGGDRHVAAVQAQKGGRAKYILTRAFPPLSTLKYGYPILKKAPVLLPCCWVHRIIKGMSPGKSKKVKYELEKSREGIQISKDIAKLYEKVGLSSKELSR